MATSTRPEEGRADQRSRSPPCHQSVDPFQRSERGPLSRNFAKKLAEGKNEALSTENHDAMVNKFEMEKAASRSASPTPIGSNRYGRIVRRPYRTVTYPTARRSDTDRTNELLHTILRNMNHLNEKVDRIEQTADASAIWIERVGGQLDYHLLTKKKEVSSDPSVSAKMLPARAEISDIWNKVTCIESELKAMRDLVEAQAAENRKLVEKMEGGYQDMVDLTAQNVSFLKRTEQERKGKGREGGQLAHQTRTPYNVHPQDEPMDWVEDVSEAEQLENKERLDHQESRKAILPNTQRQAPNRIVNSSGTSSDPGSNLAPVSSAKNLVSKQTQRSLAKTTTITPAGGISYAAAAKLAPRGGTDTAWTTVTRGGKSRSFRPQQQGKPIATQTPVQGLNLDQRKFIFVRDSTPVVPFHETKLMSAVSMALYQEKVPTHIRIFQLRRNAKGTLVGLSTPFAPIEQLLAHRDTILRAARTVDPAIVDITANETWKRLKIHGVPLERYLGKGTFGLNKLRAEIESENEGVEIPMEMRWLGRVPTIKERYHTQQIRGSSVTFVVRGQGTAERLIKSGLRVLGKQYQVEAFIEARPDTICGACSGWGHGEHNCAFSETPKCALCAGPHRTDSHRCSTVGCRAGIGLVCIHLISKCPNCKGPHGAKSDQCPKKQEAIEKGRGWRGKESGVQTAASNPTILDNQTAHEDTVESSGPAADIMQRDDGVYESKWAVQGNEDITPENLATRKIIPNSKERESMERGLEAFRKAHPSPTKHSKIPPPPPPPPSATIETVSGPSRCGQCNNKGWPAIQCTGCGRQKTEPYKSCTVSAGTRCLSPDMCAAQVSLPDSRPPSPSQQPEIMMSDAGHMADEEEL